jgi:hypothetical protein
VFTSLCEGQWDTGCQLPIFQTGLGRPVAVKHSSIKKASTILGDGDVKRSGKNTHSSLLFTYLSIAHDSSNLFPFVRFR